MTKIKRETFLIPIIETNFNLKIIKWYVDDGKEVQKGEPLLDLECEKADISLPSPVSGILTHHARTGEIVNAGEMFGEIKSLEDYSAPVEDVVPRTSKPIVRDQQTRFWTYSDGWVLASIALGLNTENSSDGADLKMIIMCGDYLNHAILTEKELSKSLTKLLQYGVITAAENRFGLTEKWAPEIRLSIPDAILESATKVGEWLNRTELKKIAERSIEITQAEQAKAYAEYIKK